MKIVVQRVSQASVKVSGKIVGEISQGLLLLVGIEENDEKEIKKAAPKGRIFRGTTLLHQINSQPLNVSHSGNAYCYFSKAVRERTSTSCPHRFSPSIGSLRRVRKFTFFRQHF